MGFRYKADREITFVKLERGWLVEAQGNTFITERRAFDTFAEAIAFIEAYYTAEGSVER